MTPIVIEETPNGERSYDLYSRLLKDRIIFLQSEITTQVAASIVAQLIFLTHEDSEKDIALYINSPGGSVSAGLSIYDTMQLVKPDIMTLGMGSVASMGQLLLTAGAPGKRFALPNTRILMHQPSGGVEGQTTDILIHAKDIESLRTLLYEIIAKHSGKSVPEISKDAERDYILTAQAAIDYGLIDQIMTQNN